MYIGRFVIVGNTAAGVPFLGYRVSSRSFPSRRIHTREDRAMVLPTADAPPTDNPYISYNCLRMVGETLVVANGSHVDPIIDKIKIGYPLRDAMALSMLAMDYEHDSYNTPRVTAAMGGDGALFLGIVTDSKVYTAEQTVTPGQALLIATYETQSPTPIALGGETADALAEAMLACEYEHPIASLAALKTADGWSMASRSVLD